MPKKKIAELISSEEDLHNRLQDPEFLEAWNESTSDIYIDIAFGLIKARKERGLSQDELAEKTHTSQQAIARLENPSYRGYSLRTLKKVSEALGKILNFKLEEKIQPAYTIHHFGTTFATVFEYTKTFNLPVSYQTPLANQETIKIDKLNNNARLSEEIPLGMSFL